MITYIKGDLFNSPAQVLVNTVNTVGVMGKGIALEFKTRYPEMFILYQSKCDDGSFDIGKLLLWKKEEKWILLFPTKRHWRSPSKISDIEEGLKKFAQSYDKLGIESIAFPKLGCGNGGLDWKDVKPIMEKYLKSLPIHIYIYLDNYKRSSLEHKKPLEIEKWLRNNTKSIGFTFLKEELQRAIIENNDFLINNSQLKHISWNEDNIYIFNGDEIIIAEEDLCDFWYHIRNLGIIEIESLPERFINYAPIMLDILKRLDYVQPIIIMSNGTESMETINGYQYISSQTVGTGLFV